MTVTNRRWMITAVGLALLVGAAYWSHQHADDAKRAAAGARSDAAACERIAAQIIALRAEGTAVAEAETAESELTGVLDASLAQAGLPAEALIRVWPERPARLDRTDYLEKPTRIHLRGVTLRQGVTFLLAVADRGPGVAVRDVRLTAARDVGQATAEAPGKGRSGEWGGRGGWNLEATLTQLIYEPREPTASETTVASSLSQEQNQP